MSDLVVIKSVHAQNLGMATPGSNAKRFQNISEAKAAVARASAVSIRLVPDLAPANLISELNAGLDYYVANVQSAITEELEKLILNMLEVWYYKEKHAEKFNRRTVKKLVNSAISPGLSGFERTRDAINQIGEIDPEILLSTYEVSKNTSSENTDHTYLVVKYQPAKCKGCNKSTKTNAKSIEDLNSDQSWHADCFAAFMLRDQTKKFRSAKGALDKQAIAVRGILSANQANSMLKGKKKDLQDIGTSIKYENWLKSLFDNWAQTTTVKEEFRASYQSAFNEYANAIVEYSNTGEFPVQATKDRLLKHLTKSEVESVLERALENDRELRARGPESAKPFMHKTLEYLGLIDTEQPTVPKVITVDAKSYADAPRVAEAFRAGNPVILNCTELAEEDRKRIIDFASGLVFGNAGTIERVTNAVFLLSPKDVHKAD